MLLSTTKSTAVTALPDKGENMIKLGHQRWVKSSYSTGQNNCVEIASPQADAVLVRDTKRPAGPTLRVSPWAFAAFVAGVKTPE